MIFYATVCQLQDTGTLSFACMSPKHFVCCYPDSILYFVQKPNI